MFLFIFYWKQKNLNGVQHLFQIQPFFNYYYIITMSVDMTRVSFFN